jgi:hypothetical protein
MSRKKDIRTRRRHILIKHQPRFQSTPTTEGRGKRELTLSRPFSEDEILPGTSSLSSNLLDRTHSRILKNTRNRTKIGKNHEWSCRRDGIDYHSLNTCDGCQLRVREENSRTESCNIGSGLRLACNDRQWEGGFQSGRHFSHARINVIEYLRYNLSFASTGPHISPKRKLDIG